VNSSNDIGTGMQALKVQGVGAVLQLPSNTVNQGIDGQIKSARDLKLPIFSLQPDQLEKGVVAAIGIDLANAGEQAGRMTAKILKGDKPDTIPLEKAKLSEIKVNETSAQQFGLSIR
jgi:putative ABC transport system substrate-binding protein